MAHFNQGVFMRHSSLFAGRLLSAVLLAIGLVLSAPRLRAQTVYSYTGSSQSYTVPSGVSLVRVKIWGAGGGAASNISGIYGSGGGAGFVQADVPVTPGETLNIIVGRGGAGWNSTEGYAGSAYPNGGAATNFGGGGGGRSEVSKSGLLLVAAGGGGGGYQFNGTAGPGGTGGPAIGGTGGSSPNNAGGSGGTQGSGGVGGYGTASTGGSGGYKQGGNANGANIPGGAAGDGYYGGGGGGGGQTGVGDSGGGGGGGSNYLTGTGLANLQNLAGSGTSPGNAGDSDRGTSGASAMGNYGPGQGATTSGYRGGNGKVVITSVQVAPQITSSLSASAAQGQGLSYQITASGNPTSYGASNLPAGLTLNPATGIISGTIPTNGGVQGSNGTVYSTITATNPAGTDSRTLAWSITAAQIVTAGAVSPSIISLGSAVTLTRDGSANFGIAWASGTIWKPDGSSEWLGNLALGSQGYTPAAGTGSYSYQFRIVDGYSNYKDQWIGFTVTGLSAPPGFQSTGTQSYSVALGWGAVAGATGYNLYRNGVKLNSSPISGTAFTDATAQPGTNYTYAVTAIATNGSESPAATINVTTAASFEVFTPLP